MVHHLLSKLTAIDECEAPLTFSLPSISATLKTCADLAKQCSDLSFVGKLLMQSNLDIVSARIDAGIITISGVYAAEARLLRLEIGSGDVKKQPLVSFNDAIEQDRRCLNLAMEVDGLAGVLVELLYSCDGGIQREAAKAACFIAGFCSYKRLLIGAGLIPPLISVLESENGVINKAREMAAETVSSMIVVPKNRRKLVQNEQSLEFFLQMLDPLEVGSGNKKLLLSIVMSLIDNSSSARKKTANSGYVKNIEKLAEAQVSDAKKIVRKISYTRLGSILNGMWHS